ncbi:GNAT family N-acetyltransferase [Psychrobacter phenylpyruvicus]|uniref:Acetyltransferase YpeA n=1 Tax=Psychrobacter phenylpyruvicus TaxID=29432 RepID=A0A379LNA1_9GAMM|nr:GNAT family N-acetyltransferase [Psychrobacter phenylpyruvicus]SUD92086.1 Acetyltransferase YpeA [Psychrobacter phenylpyruvicus]
MLIRPMTMNDYDAVYQLWINTPGMGLNDIDDSYQGIKRMLTRNPTLSFVAENEYKEIIGVIIAGEDGRRGYIYHTAVLPAYRNQGLGQALVKNVLDEMSQLSISKVGLFIFQRNEIGNKFWERLGFNVRDDLYYRNKAITVLERIDT